MTTLFFVKFPDGATYAIGPQTGIQGKYPGGALGFELHEQAQRRANAIEDGYVIKRNLDYAREFCYTAGLSLYIKQADGQVICYPPAIDQSQKLIRIEGEQRQRLMKTVETTP